PMIPMTHTHGSPANGIWNTRSARTYPVIVAPLAARSPASPPSATNSAACALESCRSLAPSVQIGRAHGLNSSHRTISYAVFCLKKKSSEKFVLHLRTHFYLPRRKVFAPSQHAAPLYNSARNKPQS